jgi:hypothetical protein
MMPWATVKLIPGVNLEATPTLNQAGITNSDNIRFKAGLPQKLGGWQPYYDGIVAGTPRTLHPWQDLNDVKRLAVATTTQVIVLPPDSIPQDITPQTLDTDPTPDFSTTMGSTTVDIVDDSGVVGFTTDMAVYFRVPIAIGGIVLSGVYPISLVTGADSYQIEHYTPATATEANAGTVPSFVSTENTATIEVTLVDHTQSVGNVVVFDEPTTVGGVIVQGRYVVTDITPPDDFTITAGMLAVANDTATMNGGDAGFTYYIALGPQPAGAGYGIGFYGLGGYGLGTSSGALVGTPITMTNATLDNWGEILFMGDENGGIYWWQPNSGFQNLRLIATGPLFNKGMFASMGAQQIIAFGSSIDARLTGGIGIYQDPLLLQWCDIGNFLQWTPSPSNFARNFRLPRGSVIVGAGATKNRNLVWTDLALWTLTFNGGNSVYSPNEVGSNCGLIGMHAWTSHADTAYWMGFGNFFRYSGSGVQVMPCSVWDAVFQDLNPDFSHLSYAGPNTDFTEIWFFYPSLAGGGMIDKYAKYNTVEDTWDSGSMDRCCWTDRSVLGNPIGITNGGIIYYHEMGRNADNVPLIPMFETGRFTIDEGETIVFVDEVWPDFKWGERGGSDTAQIGITLLAYDESGDTAREYGPFIVTRSTPSFQPARELDKTRVRAREVAMRVTSNDMDSFWRLGAVRFRHAPDGKR